MSDGLLPQHAALLTASAIADEVAEARGYRSVQQKSRLIELGFAATQARVPALLIPIWNVQGEIALYQTRADEPRIVDGKAVKYETPRGSRMQRRARGEPIEKLRERSARAARPRGDLAASRCSGGPE